MAGFGYQVLGFGSGAAGDKFICASGGTESTSGNFKIHKFTGPGTFTVSGLATCSSFNNVSWMVVAGGGSGTGRYGGGGGAGGFRESPAAAGGCYSTSPKAGGSPITVSVQGYPITVGGGGSDSVFDSITSRRGGNGSGGNGDPPWTPGNPGGSGGGGFYNSCGGAGNDPPVSPSQGNPGAKPNPLANTAGGGGGATQPGQDNAGGPKPGGAGATTSISGTPTAYAGGGAGSTGSGGNGGGGDGGPSSQPGTANTGGGGGGRPGNPGGGGSGGSGIVIIRYKFQDA